MEYNKIFVVFKTHLDVGFTDYAENVVNRYFTRLIPSALKTAQEVSSDSENRFIWTTGSWLIYEYLENATSENRKHLEKAIISGNICWHALPFTTHTECMDRALFEYGLSLSEKLDKQFGKKTIAAKMTDVPGHTRAMVPLLAKHGVEFLHIGVNPACTPPDVPSLFLWRAPDDSEIAVMYEGKYGDFSPIGDTGSAVYFAHTGDNAGVPSVEAVTNIFAQLRSKYPHAKICSANLNDVADAIRPIRNKLPVITQEIGDTWIHGIASDPRKIKEYRGLLRFAKTLSSEMQEHFYRNLLMIPEHTWGMDVKTHFHERQFFSTEELSWIRNPEMIPPKEDRTWQEQRDINMATLKAKYIERSWQEQRDYLTAAIAALPEEEGNRARQYLKSIDSSFLPEDELLPLSPDITHEMNGYRVSVNKAGEITCLQSDEYCYCTEDKFGGQLIYEIFSEEDYEVKFKQYNEGRDGAVEDWALEDFHKYGMEQASASHKQYRPILNGLYQYKNKIIEHLSFEDEAVKKFGCPREWEIRYDLSDPMQVDVEVLWKNKRATRVSESIWFGFMIDKSDCYVRKLGEWVNCSEVVNKGGRCLWGTDYGVKTQTILLESDDSSLISCGLDTLLSFDCRKACADRGLFVNLYNNIWATNFPLWYDEDAHFRMSLKPVVKENNTD